MNIGMVGMGKLGLSCALAIESKGHCVKGYDIDPNIQGILDNKKLPYREEIAKELIKDTQIELTSLKYLSEWADIIYVAVQTPHKPEFEGITRLPDERADFNYEYLKAAIIELNKKIELQNRAVIVIVISTVLPGTIRREIMPLLNEYILFGYNPFFIAMGTTVNDFLNPEFVLLGTESEYVAQKMTGFYASLHGAPIIRMSIESAELTKVSYNTYITAKITIANMIMEMAEKTGANCDEVTKALKAATDRIVSPKYMSAGMGDGGGCHPRDNIALSYIARNCNLSYDFYDSLMKAREAQTEWLADIIIEKHKETGYDICIMGYAFKAETNITIGSAVILLMNILDEKNIAYYKYDPFVEDRKLGFKIPQLFFMGMNHNLFKKCTFPEGSIVIDPWGIIKPQDDVELISIGRK